MQLIENTDDGSNLINTVDERVIIVNKNEVTQSCIISNSSLIIDLDLTTVANLQPSHIEHLLSSNPEVVIFGSGIKHVFPGVSLLTSIAKQNIGFEVMNNKSAARTYNVLVTEERKVACLLII